MPKKHYGWGPGQKPPIIEAHSSIKHELYEKYLFTYVDRLTRFIPQEKLVLTVVDGFCGGGLYQDHGQIIHGSPLRLLYAMEAAQLQRSQQSRKGFHIDAHFYFVDCKKQNLGYLREQLIHQGFGARIDKSIFLVHSAFDAASPQIIRAIKQRRGGERALFLLDQYGWSHVSFKVLRTIFQELKNPEIILTFAVDFLIDYLSPTSSKLDASLAAIDIDRKRVEELIALKGSVAARGLIQNFLYKHVIEYTGASFYSPFFLHSNGSNKDLWLIHLSQHRQAREEMGKIHWDLGNASSHHGRYGFNSLGFKPHLDWHQQLLDFTFTDEDWDQSGNAVLEQLPGLLESMNRPATVEELFSSNCNDTPVVLDIVNEQLAHLRDYDEVVIKSVTGSLRSRTSTFDWSDRVELNPQRTLFSVPAFVRR